MLSLTDCIVLLFFIVEAATIPLYFVIIYIITKGRSSTFSGSFYSLFLALAVLDVISSTAAVIGVFLPAWGVTSNLWIQSTWLGRVYFGIAFGARVSQGFSSALLAANRMSAIVFPIRYKTAWRSSRMPFIVALPFVPGTIFCIVILAHEVKYVRNWNSDSQKMITYLASKQFYDHLFMTGGTILTVQVLIILICYGLVLKTLCKKMYAEAKNNSGEVTPKDTPLKSAERSATRISVCLSGMEIIFYAYSITSVVYDIHNTMTAAYSSLNCYLLLAFSKSIRQEFKSVNKHHGMTHIQNRDMWELRPSTIKTIDKDNVPDKAERNSEYVGGVFGNFTGSAKPLTTSFVPTILL